MTVSAILSAVRASTPLVHCMTNTVVPEVTANVLLAAGAAPAMIDLRGGRDLRHRRLRPAHQRRQRPE